MCDNSIIKKNKSINMRVADYQLNLIDDAKKGSPLLSNTNILMCGVHLLNIVLQYNTRLDNNYEELINALIIEDGFAKAMSKENNLDNKDMANRKKKNEIYILSLLQSLIKEKQKDYKLVKTDAIGCDKNSYRVK